MYDEQNPLIGIDQLTEYDGEIKEYIKSHGGEGGSMPTPTAKDKLLISDENLEWTEIDKTDIGGTTYEFQDGMNKFTVTSSDGSTQDVNVIPDIIEITKAQYDALEDKKGTYFVNDDDGESLDASGVKYDNTISGLASTTVQGAIDKTLGQINELKKSVSDGKTLVANAITDKGVQTASDAEFAVMATNIGNIQSGSNVTIDGEPYESDLVLKTNDQNEIWNSLLNMVSFVGVDTQDILPYAVSSTRHCIMYNNEIHIIGGSNTNRNHYKFDGVSWTKLSDTPSIFRGSSFVVYNNEIHCLGGNYSTGVHKQHYKFDGTSWIADVSLPHAFAEGIAVVYKNSIHILGGYSNGVLDIHYKFDGTSWSEVNALPPINTWRGSGVIYNNEIHILGGSSNYTSHYKFNGTSWTQVSTIPQNVYLTPALIYNNEIHILGGLNNNYQHHKFNGVSWIRCNDLPYSFSSGSAVLYNSDIHLLSSSSTGCTKFHYRLLESNNILTYLKQYYINALDNYNNRTIIGYKYGNLPNKFYRGNIVSYNNEIHILGGYGNSTSHYKFNGTTWIKVSVLPDGFYDGVAVILNNEIHLIGSQMPNYKQHYKFDGTSWTKISTLPHPYYNNGAVVINNEIHILGGQSSDSRKKHYKFDGVSWTEVSTLPYDYYNGSLVNIDNEIHILGGYGGYTSHYKFDGVSWISASTLPYSFYYGAAIVLNDEIHIFGGNSSDYTVHYKFDGSSWTKLDNLPYEFKRSLVVVHNNEIHMLGSENNNDALNHYNLSLEEVLNIYGTIIIQQKIF